jgi:hypothetical protein
MSDPGAHSAEAPGAGGGSMCPWFIDRSAILLESEVR